eukprot:Em0023g350a
MASRWQLASPSEQGEPITERSNDITENIDTLSPLGIVRQLRQVDAQIFAGWRHWESILDDGVLSTADRVSNTVIQFLEDTDNNAVVLSGCGTSGRLAFVIAKTFNRLLCQRAKQPFYHYIISGGDKAILKSGESEEDSWSNGVHSLEKVTDKAKKVLFIGITCGLSAPFVAAQLDHCLRHLEKYTPVLLGFNLPSMARTSKVHGSALSFKDVVDNLLEQEAKGRAFVLTPIVGPEAIAGSTRLKSGSATKMLLEAILMRAHQRYYRQREIGVAQSLLSYKTVYTHTFLQSKDIAAMLELAGQSLSSGGHVYYLGVKTAGILALIDASECPPTFGAGYNDVRAFLHGGNAALGLQEDPATKDPGLALGWDYFTSHFLPTLTWRDLVIFVLSRQDMDAKLATEVSGMCSSIHTQKGAILVGTGALPEVDSSMFRCCIRVLLPHQVLSSYWSSGLEEEEEAVNCEMAVKWALNAISTGAHIMKGKVLCNKMVDLQLSNDKLFHRGVKMVEDFGKLSKQEALKCVLSSIYTEDNVEASLLSDSVEKHITNAMCKTKVMPLALLKSTGRFSIHEASCALEQDPVIRSVLTKQTLHLNT